jgi:rRNA maturation endonuclease Nob1
MAHLKCLACKTRLYSTEGDPIGDRCPVCGSPLVAFALPATTSTATRFSTRPAIGSPPVSQPRAV